METNHTAPDITTGFIQMVEAYKVKPELEARIAELEHTIQRLNERDELASRAIDELETKADALLEDKARLTRERDDAMFRSLELEEKTKSVGDLVAKLTGLVNPEPVAKAEAPVEQPMASVDVEQGTVRQAHSPFYGSEGEGNVETFRSEYSGQGEGKSETPNWDSPTKAEQNASGPMASPHVSEPQPQRHENSGKPYHEKPWWVNDNDWRNQGGQGPHEGGSWETPWEQRA